MNTKSIDSSFMSLHRGQPFPVAGPPNTYRSVLRRTEEVISRIELEGSHGSAVLDEGTQVFAFLQVVDSLISQVLWEGTL
jgi:hypothetical protein